MNSPTQRTLKVLRDMNMAVDVVEHWNAYARRRIDLFNIIDIVAVEPGQTYGVQCTSDSNVSARVAKIKAAPVFPLLLSAGWRIQVWGWRKKKGRWINRIVEMTHET